MDAARKGQVTKSAADVYEEFFVPALFGEWGPKLSDAARLSSGQKVLDMCLRNRRSGTCRKGSGRPLQGSVIGYDRNEGMLAVAARMRNDIEWRTGTAENPAFLQ